MMLQQVVGDEARAALDADRVADAGEVLDMRAFGLAGAVADPQHVAGGGVVLAGDGVAAGQRLLVAEQQRLVRGVELGLAQRRGVVRVEAEGAHEVDGVIDLLGQFLEARIGRRCPS